ncbi:MAG TPA: molybdopterin synthase sulfur carrier subunit [Spirochaetaceae bacterium]|nr:molybdopterin synthase sulfur carrier subunit [Spirochaetaceae bacterium]
MTITIKLFASLRQGRFESESRALAEGSSVLDALELVGVSAAEAAVLFVNSRHAGPKHILAEGDSLAVFPPVGGG